MSVNIANIQGYALTLPPAPIAVRTITGYAMGVAPLSIALRSVFGYAMVDNGPVPTGSNGHDAVLKMIADHAVPPRPTSHFTIGLPTAYVDAVGRNNTKVTATATAASLLSGSMDFIYRRIPLSRLPASVTNITFGNIQTIHELIPAINSNTGMTLTTADLVDGPIPSAAAELTITAAETSYFFIPGSTAKVGKLIPLTSLFKNDSLLWI